MLSSIDGDSARPRAVIFGVAATELTPAEAVFFSTAQPLGFILFKRNCDNPVQLKSLIQSLHSVVGREVPVLIDQEGGQVQRLRPPHWTEYPLARVFGDTCDWMALSESTDKMARELVEQGFNVDCAPVLDVRSVLSPDVIRDRMFASDPALVAALGAVACEAFLKAGVVPVVKHMPGLGRANLDTHFELPAVAVALEDLKQVDFLPFRDLSRRPYAKAVWGMVSHAIYNAIDAETPASCSAKVIRVIREAIGFQGLLLSDDLGMGALNVMGTPAQRAMKTLEAGCDIALHCNGNLEEMRLLAECVPLMTKDAVLRYNSSVTVIREWTRA